MFQHHNMLCRSTGAHSTDKKTIQVISWVFSPSMVGGVDFKNVITGKKMSELAVDKIIIK